MRHFTETHAARNWWFFAVLCNLLLIAICPDCLSMLNWTAITFALRCIDNTIAFLFDCFRYDYRCFYYWFIIIYAQYGVDQAYIAHIFHLSPYNLNANHSKMTNNVEFCDFGKFRKWLEIFPVESKGWTHQNSYQSLQPNALHSILLYFSGLRAKCKQCFVSKDISMRE